MVSAANGHAGINSFFSGAAIGAIAGAAVIGLEYLASSNEQSAISDGANRSPATAYGGDQAGIGPLGPTPDSTQNGFDVQNALNNNWNDVDVWINKVPGFFGMIGEPCWGAFEPDESSHSR